LSRWTLAIASNASVTVLEAPCALPQSDASSSSSPFFGSVLFFVFFSLRVWNATRVAAAHASYVAIA
jgi:hypothetical protein